MEAPRIGQINRRSSSRAFEQQEMVGERLDRLVSLLRAWSAAPSQFDGLSPRDRQNLFLLATELAESARTATQQANATEEQSI